MISRPCGMWYSGLAADEFEIGLTAILELSRMSRTAWLIQFKGGMLNLTPAMAVGNDRHASEVIGWEFLVGNPDSFSCEPETVLRKSCDLLKLQGPHSDAAGGH